MQLSQLPTKTALPFADSGSKNVIPVPSQIQMTPGAASFTDGFPPATRVPVENGGIPPYGQDMNGILNHATALTRWYSAGGPIAFDPAFAAAVGGYPQGALLANASTPGAYWLSTADANVSNPDAGQTTGWTALTIPRTGSFVTSDQLAAEIAARAAGDTNEANVRASNDNGIYSYVQGNYTMRGMVRYGTAHANFFPGDNGDVPITLSFTTGAQGGILFMTSSLCITTQNAQNAQLRQVVDGQVVNQEGTRLSMMVQTTQGFGPNAYTTLETHLVTGSSGGAGWAQAALGMAYLFVPG